MAILSTFVFDTSESAYAELGRALDRLNTQAWSGFLGAWIGRATNDKCTTMYKEAYIALAWASIEAYDTTQSKSSYIEFITRHLEPALKAPSSQTSRHRVQFKALSDNAMVAFDSPLTEVLLHRIKDGKKRDGLDAVVAEVVQFLADNDVGVRTPRVDGEIFESSGDDEFYTAIGWDGPEAHDDAVKLERLQDYVAKFLEVADVKQAWVKFEKRA